MKGKAISICALVFVGVLLLGTELALAQTTGHLKGRISDSQGAAIEKTQIIVESSSGRFEASTNEDGDYNLELPAGTYDVSTKKMPGFVALTHKKVEVKPGKDTTLNVKLKVTLDDAICVLYIGNAPVSKKPTTKKKKGKN
jgi:hypothetical protein